MTSAWRALVSKHEGIRSVRKLSVDGRIILKCILNRVQGCEMDLSGSG
jgi:hypothetical protein